MKRKNLLHHVMLLIALSILVSACVSNDSLGLDDLRCEYRVNPLGIDNVTPRLSWKMIDLNATRGQQQTAYQIVVASSEKALKNDKGDLWDSGKKSSGQSVNISYGGKSLVSNTTCYWKVRVWDMNGEMSSWSAPAFFSVGLLNADDWTGEWIQKADQDKIDHIWYRKNVTLASKPETAMVYLASLGYHELYVNGDKITDNILNPASSYLKTRVPYIAYDISDKLVEGDNVIAVWHAAGWTRWIRIREHRNVPFTFKAQVEIQLNDEVISFATDTSWKCTESHSKYIGNWNIQDFGGELIDARRMIADWCASDFDDTSWDNAVVCKGKTPKHISAQMVEPQVAYQKLAPVSIKATDKGDYLVDMGTNYSGLFSIVLKNGTEGDTVTFAVSDVPGVTMNKSQRSQYVFDKTGKGVFTNRFNIAGGRWFTLKGLTYKPELSDIEGYVITSNRKRISQFECSDKLLNEIYEMNIRTLVANTLDGILMDCPHRERRGWGEVTVAAMYGDAFPNFESAAFMDQYFQYMRDAQFPDGRNRAIVNEEDRPFLMWQANNPITVWEAYRFFGDKTVLADNYAALEKWMDWILDHSNYATGGALKAGKAGKREFPGLGDWATPHGNDFTSCNAPAAVHFNNCLYAYMLEIAHKIALELDKNKDAEEYAKRLKVQREATHQDTYNGETGLYLDGLQIDQAYALISGVTPKAEQQKVYDNLVDKVLYDFPYYDVGSSGQALYTRYFIEHGERMDLIYELLTDTRHPSYSYFIERGETTWPELWSSVGPSRIHTCYTGIGGYFVMGFGGIRVDDDHCGFQQFLIKPAVVGDLTYANTSYESLYGKIVSNWTKDGENATFHVEVPVNTTAKVFIPSSSKDAVTEGAVLASEAQGVDFVRIEKSEALGQYIVYEVQSGVYDFVSTALSQVSYPEPLYAGTNIARIGRATASSMKMLDIQNPGQEAFRANDDKASSKWVAKQNDNQWLEIEWMKPQSFNKVIVKEEGNHIMAHKIQYLANDQWVDLVTGASCGAHKEHHFETVSAKKCRLLIEKANDLPAIASFEIHRSETK